MVSASTVGLATDGLPVSFDASRLHTLVVGMTGSGKSSTARLLVARALEQGARIVGLDPENGLLRPFADEPLVANGTAVEGLEHGLRVLEAAVAEIEVRIASLPSMSEALTRPTVDCPQWLVVVEELQVLGQRYKAAGKSEYSRFTEAMQGILVQGRKALIHCLAITQRPLSDVVPGRSQFGRIIIHRMNQRKDVSLVWDGLSEDLQARLSVARPGQAVVIDDQPIPRFCSIDYVTYQRFVRRIECLRKVG